jgi:hypothetical protein
MRGTSWQVIIVLTLIFVSYLHGQAKNAGITESQAHELARMTMLPSGRNLPDMRFNEEDALKPGPFYWFSITARVPDDESPLLGAFAVNKLSGDVWDVVSCKRLVNKDVLSAQARLRHEMHTSESVSTSHSHIAPCAP